MTRFEHRKTIAAIFFALGLLDLFGWISVGGWRTGEWLFLSYSVFLIITGWKLHNKTPGAKIFAVLASLLSIPSFPFGTIIGVYGLWYCVLGQKKRY